MDRHLKVEMNDFRLLASGDFYLRGDADIFLDH